MGGGKSVSEALEILKSEKKHSEGYETLKGIDIFLTKHLELEMPELKKVRDIFLNIDILEDRPTIKSDFPSASKS